jgi:hypothetical protein
MKKKTKEPYKIYISYEESRTGGAPIGDGPYCNHEDSYIEFKITDVFTKPGNWNETLEVGFIPEHYAGTEIYILVVRYSTGDTFSHTEGAWKIVNAYTDSSLAETIGEDIKKHAHWYDSREYDKTSKKYKQLEPTSANLPEYRPWEGYFDTFTSTEIYRRILRDETCTGTRFL